MYPPRKLGRATHLSGKDIKLVGSQDVTWLHQSGADVLLDVLLVASAERTRVVGISERRLKISVTAEAGAQANEALVRFVTRTLAVARAQVSIVGGVPVSRRKTLRLASVAAARARLRLHPNAWVHD